MNFHFRPLAVGSHRRVQLPHCKVDGKNLGKPLLHGTGDATGHMFQQAGGLPHLAGHEVIENSIVERVGHVVAFQRTL